MEVVFRHFKNYNFENSPSYRSTLEQVYMQYLIVLSDKDLEVKQDITNGVFNEERIPEADREQLQLQTKVFVFCSETDNILELQEYQYWLATSGKAEDNAAKLQEVSDGTMVDGNSTEQSQLGEVQVDGGAATATATDEAGEYRSNYEEVVDMIVNNKPIPGIKQIPKTVLDPAEAPASVLQPRKKPWEQAQAQVQDDDTAQPPADQGHEQSASL
jgi:hypothetical protein